MTADNQLAADPRRRVFVVSLDIEHVSYEGSYKIKEPLKSCLLLKQQGLSYKEIAGSLDLNEASIGTFIARARQEFTRFYGKIGKETL